MTIIVSRESWTSGEPENADPVLSWHIQPPDEFDRRQESMNNQLRSQLVAATGFAEIYPTGFSVFWLRAEISLPGMLIAANDLFC
jgi:hypothetical protein